MSYFDFITLIPKTIDSIDIGCFIEEAATDELQITEHPVEKGAQITDHAFKLPAEVTIQCGWSNSDLRAVVDSAVAAYNTAKSFLSGSAATTQTVKSEYFTSSDYIGKTYKKLLELQAKREPFTVTTGLRTYKNMLFKSLRMTQDQKTGQALMVSATFREIRIVETKATTLPDKNSQAAPKETAETQNAGAKAAAPATPAPGGSAPPDTWALGA